MGNELHEAGVKFVNVDDTFCRSPRSPFRLRAALSVEQGELVIGIPAYDTG